MRIYMRQLAMDSDPTQKKDLFIAQVTNGTAWEVRNKAKGNMPVARFEDEDSAKRWLKTDLSRLNIIGECLRE